MFPVRCFTCGSVLGDRYDEYESMLKKHKPGDSLDKLGITRYCCRRMFLSHVDMAKEIARYEKF